MHNILEKKWYGGLYHLHNTSDTWEQWIRGFEPSYNYEPKVAERFTKIIANNSQYIKNRKVIDLACNLGYFSLACSSIGATSVLGLEVRQEYLDTVKRVIKYWPANNVSIKKSNIENLVELEKHLKGVDTILYAGHFYHTNQQELLLQLFTNSSASCMILESIVPPINSNESYSTTEAVSNPLNGFVDEENNVIDIRIPSQKQTKIMLGELGWEIVNEDETTKLHSPKRFIITAIKKE